MKKKSLYIIFTFIIMILFNTNLDALTCTYQNPYDINGKDIIIEFSTKVDKTGKVADKEVNTCIDASKSSFFGESFDLHFWNPNPNNLGIYDKDSFFQLSYKPGVYWAFWDDTFEFKGKDCVKNALGAEAVSSGKGLTCPSLQIQTITKISGSNVKIINMISTKKTFTGSESKQLVLKNGSTQDIDKDGNVIKEDKSVDTCNYSLDVSKMDTSNGFLSPGNSFKSETILEVQAWSNGITKYKLDGYDVTLDLSRDYPFDIYTNIRQAYFLMTKNNVNKISIKGNEDEGYYLNCQESGYVYYDKNLKTKNGHKGAYVITFSKNDIPNDAEYVMFGKYADDNTEYGQLQGSKSSSEIGTCTMYLGEISNPDSLANLLDSVYTIIKILTIIITILWCMLDMAKTITYNKDELMNMIKKCAIRLIIMIIILLLPTFIDIIGNLAGKKDILCGIK